MEDEIRKAVRAALRDELPGALSAALTRIEPADGKAGWVSIPRAAELTGFAEEVIRRHCVAGNLRATMPEGSAHYRIALADLRAWIEGGKSPPLSVAARAARILDPTR